MVETAPVCSLGGRFLIWPSAADCSTVLALVDDGTVALVIDRTFRLAETADEIAYLESGDARGKVVVDVDSVRSS